MARTYSLRVRMSRAEKDALAALAARQGLTPSSYVRSMILTRARKLKGRR